MEKQSNSVREIGQFLSVVIASVLFGSTLILSAVGPARASEMPLLANPECPAATHYLA
ncbi:hypothetical protein VVT58_13810 [Sphingobium sp. SJ10-10]|uniref:hypothetical protein n=1 Tax=Sphingobium sp. SJ10-10 TaxID=3114999 RepID=UPI002E18F7FF|nr:hypothetical protein [Sphingobium sp. SJ10-10]